MGFSLRNLLDQAVAQVNPLDNGKTAATVRRATQSAPPAQIPVNNPAVRPNQSISNRVRDIFDANTASDNFRRYNSPQAQYDRSQEAIFSQNLKNIRQQVVNKQITPTQARGAALSAAPSATAQASDVLMPTNLISGMGQKVVNVTQNRVAAPVALGMGRSVAGGAEGFGGLYDLITPGTGNSRFTQASRRAGESTDKTVKAQGYNQALYKGGQLAGEAAQLLAPGAVAGKFAEGANISSKLASKAPLLEKATQGLSEGSKAEKAAATALRYASRPSTLLNTGVNTLQNSGYRSARGEKITPGTVAIDTGTGLAFGGLLEGGGKVLGTGLIKGSQKAEKTLRDKQIIRPSRLNDSEVNDLSLFREKAGTGAIMDEGTYQRGVVAADKAGIDYRDPTQVDDLLSKHLTYDTRKAEAKANRETGSAEIGGPLIPIPKKVREKLVSLPDSIPTTSGDVYYHGTDAKSADSLIKNGYNPNLSSKGIDNVESPYALFASASKDANSDHSAGTYGNTFVKITPKKGAVLLDGSSRTWADTMGQSHGAKESAQWATKLKAMGYDGIKENNGEVTIFNHDKFNYTTDKPPAKSTPATTKQKFGTSDKYVYHTDSTNAPIESIAKQGIRPSKEGYSGEGVYMANTPERTLGYTTNDLNGSTQYRIDKEALVKEYGIYPKSKTGVQFDETTGEVLLDGGRSIPPKFIEVKKGNEWVALGASKKTPSAPQPPEVIQSPVDSLPNGTTKQSKFAKGASKSNEISPELQANIKVSNPTYEPVTNQAQIDQSHKLIGKGYKKAAVDVTERLNVEEGKLDGQTVADTIAVIKRLDESGTTANIQKATELTDKLSQHLTKAGQTIQAASILNNRTPQGLLYSARKTLTKNGVEITPELQTKLKLAVDAIKAAKPGEAKNYKIAELAQLVDGSIPSSKVDKAVGLWKAGLLTGIKTQTGNTLSGVVTTGLKKLSDVPATGLDHVAALFGKTDLGKKLGFTGERSKMLTGRGLGTGVVEGAKKGAKSLVTGIDERNIEANKFENTKKLVFSKSPLGRAAQRYTDTVYGLMGAADRPNYYANLRNTLYELAMVDAKNKGLTGSAKVKHIENFLKEPPMKAAQTASNAAERAIFSNDTQLSKWAGSLRSAADGNPIAETALNVLMPFTKVPSAVAMRLVDYSPVGAVGTLAKAIKQVNKTGKLDQRALVEGLAEAGVGTGAMFIGYKLKQANLMTGDYPTDQKERELWKLEGKQPNSIKVNGQWQSINYTSPLGQILSTGAKAFDAEQGGAKGVDLLTQTAAGGAKTITGQSFLQGVQGGLDLINDPERNASRYIRQQAGSVVPTLAGDIAKATDPLQRQSNTPIEAIQAKIPRLSRNLNPKQDAFGEALPRQSSGINQMVNPLRPSNERAKTDLNSELRRLQDINLGVMPNTTDKTYSYGSKEKGNLTNINLTPQQIFDRNNTRGALVKDQWTKIIATPEYQNMSDTEKKKTLSAVLDDANALARSEFAAKYNQEQLDKIKLDKSAIALGQNPGGIDQYIKTNVKTSKTGKKSVKTKVARAKTGRRGRKGSRSRKGKFDYKLYGFGSSPNGTSTQLRALLKKATMKG